MATIRRRSAAVRVFVAAMAAAGLLGVSAVLFPAASFAASGITVTSGGCSGGGTSYCFNPESASATTGGAGAVNWTNQSGVAHTATSCTASACSGAPSSTGSDTFNVSIDGSSGSFTFTSPGTYYYYCTIHGYAAMHGSITVTAASTATPTPKPSSGVGGTSTTTPATGGAGGPGGLIALITGAVLLTLAVIARRR